MEYFRELSVAHTLVRVVAGSAGSGVLTKKTVVAQRFDTPERARAEWRRLVEREAESWVSCEYVKRLRPAPPRVVPHADFERRVRASDSAEDAAVFRDWLIEHDDPRAELALQSTLGDVRDWFLERPELQAEFDAFIGDGLRLSWRHGFLRRAVVQNAVERVTRALFACPLVAWSLTELSLGGEGVNAALIATGPRGPAQLTRLDLQHTGAPHLLAHLFQNDWPALRHLRVLAWNNTADWLLATMAAPWFPTLRKLTLCVWRQEAPSELIAQHRERLRHVELELDHRPWRGE